MSARFAQFHVLTSYGPSNLNRDDLGSPKTARMGGVNRLRVSSQCLKRAWRTSDEFQAALAGHLGTRTKRIGREVEAILRERGRSEKEVAEWAQAIASQFGKLRPADTKDGEAEPETEVGDESAAESGKKTKGKKAKGKHKALSSDVETLVFLSEQERAAVHKLANELEASPTEAQLMLLRESNASADLALFGRMLASAPKFNVEAAAQVAHAITVHAAEPEDDYFTAVDDLNKREETGSGHLGEAGFGAGVFYLYACINLELLRENLGGNAELAERTVRAFAHAMTRVAPTGKQNSHASRAAASYALVELGDEQPRQLSAAFVKPVTDEDVVNEAVERMEALLRGFDAVYGQGNRRFGFNVHSGGAAAASTVEADALPGTTLADKLAGFATGQAA
ncbi:type I-E CRISPR-associated protein Cas7/Cse4/CasC [Thermomonas brevis]